jgi:hypothetical protein
MPGNEVQEELIIESRSSGELGQVLSNAAHEETKEAGASKGRDWDVRWDNPAEETSNQDSWVFFDPLIV